MNINNPEKKRSFLFSNYYNKKRNTII